MAITRRSGPRTGLMRDIQRTQFERILGNASKISLVMMGLVVTLVALNLGQVILAPIFLAVTIGLMFGPVADLLEARGIPDSVSAAIVVLCFLLLIAIGIGAFAIPLADWGKRLPATWAAMQRELANWREPLAAIGAMQEQVKGALGDTPGSVTVKVEDGSAVADIALLAPAVLAQILVFLASLYFFMATRDQIRIFVLSLCVSRRMRWRTAHIFRDIEEKVSKFLLTVTVINLGIGVAVGVAMALIGMPTPILWGGLAAVLNFVPFVGQAVMVVVLFTAGMGTQAGLFGALLPVAIYLAIGFIEGNFITPNLLGRAMTMNPFLIFFSITYWLWAWGPVGGFIAVPSLLVLYSVVTHILPVRPLPRKVQRKLDAEASADVNRVGEKVRSEIAEERPVPKPAAAADPTGAAKPAAPKQPRGRRTAAVAR